MDASIRAGLRALSREEEGLGFNCLPAGVYGFTYAPLSESPLFSRQGYHAFEMQRLPDGSGRLIAYLSAAEAEAIETGDEALELGVYPSRTTMPSSAAAYRLTTSHPCTGIRLTRTATAWRLSGAANECGLYRENFRKRPPQTDEKRSKLRVHGAHFVEPHFVDQLFKNDRIVGKQVHAPLPIIEPD
jgi:hypothetical protein